MRLAAPEVRLQLDHRVPAPAGEPQHRAPQQGADPRGQEGAAVEVLGVAVFGPGRSRVHLREVGRELRLLVVPRAHVFVRDDHLPPRAQPGLRFRVCRPPLLDPVPGALVADDPQQFLANRVGGSRLRRRTDRGEEPLRRVERPVAVLGTERLLVREGVPDLAQFAHPGTFSVTKRLPKYALPVVRHRSQHGLAVPLDASVAAAGQREGPVRIQPRRPVLTKAAAKAPLHKGREPPAPRPAPAAPDPGS